MKKIVTFGEIMGRFETLGHRKMLQSLPGELMLTFGGAEANVAASLSNMGKEVRFISALPNNALGDSCERFLKSWNIDTQFIYREAGRLGLFFLETGADYRPGSVTYDRANSVMSRINGDSIDWSAAFTDAEWLHTTGITPAISQSAAKAVRTAMKEARKAGLTISCDLNFRSKLWLWDKSLSPRKLARKTVRELMPFVDVIIANEEDAWDVLDIKADHSDVSAGEIDAQGYVQVCREIVRQFPNVGKVAITLRISRSASHNDWGGLIYDAKENAVEFAPQREDKFSPYQMKNIVDRVGGGDSFGAGLIYAFTTPELNSLDTAIQYAVAASCLCHTIPGDMNYSSRAEIERLMAGEVSGRVQR